MSGFAACHPPEHSGPRGRFQQERGHRHEVRIVGVIRPIALEGVEVVRVAKLGTQVLEDGPVPPLPPMPDLSLEVPLEIERDAVGPGASG